MFKPTDTPEPLAVYLAMRSEKRLNKANGVLTYRCPKRDAVLHAFYTPFGIIVGRPGHVVSPQLADRQIEPSAVERHTSDGQHWPAAAAYLEDVHNQSVNCRHIRNRLVTNEQIEADLRSGYTERVIAADQRA